MCVSLFIRASLHELMDCYLAVWEYLVSRFVMSPSQVFVHGLLGLFICIDDPAAHDAAIRLATHTTMHIMALRECRAHSRYRRSRQLCACAVLRSSHAVRSAASRDTIQPRLGRRAYRSSVYPQRGISFAVPRCTPCHDWRFGNSSPSPSNCRRRHTEASLGRAACVEYKAQYVYQVSSAPPAVNALQIPGQSWIRPLRPVRVYSRGIRNGPDDEWPPANRSSVKSSLPVLCAHQIALSLCNVFQG